MAQNFLGLDFVEDSVNIVFLFAFVLKLFHDQLFGNAYGKVCHLRTDIA